MIISEYFAGLAKRLGIPEDSEELKPLLGMTASIPESLSDKLTGLMTEGEAKNNLTVKNHFIAAFGDGIVANVMRQAQEYGVNTAELGEEFKFEKSSGKKIQRLTEEIAKAQEAKVKATANKDPEALQKANDQIKAANAQVTKIKEDYETKLAEKDTFLATYKKKNELAQLLNRQLVQTPWSEVIPETVRESLFYQLLDSEMAKLGTVFQLDGDKPVLKQAKDPDLIFHYQNKEFTPSDLVAKVMTDNKLIAVAPKAAERTIMTGTQNQVPPVGGEGARRTAPSAFQNALNKSLADQVAQQ